MRLSRDNFPTGSNDFFRQNQEMFAEHEMRMDLEKPMKADVAAEKELQSTCENYLRQHDIEYMHPRPKAREHKGWPDLVFALDGQATAVELKSAQGRLSPDQVRCLRRLHLNGWSVHVVTRFEYFVRIVNGE